jgi:hypothetical protein
VSDASFPTECKAKANLITFSSEDGDRKTK